MNGDILVLMRRPTANGQDHSYLFCDTLEEAEQLMDYYEQFGWSFQLEVKEGGK